MQVNSLGSFKSFTYDRKADMVYLRDDCLKVLAWGASSSKTSYLRRNNIPIPPGQRRNNGALLVAALEAANASDAQIRDAANNFPQTRINGQSILRYFNLE